MKKVLVYPCGTEIGLEIYRSLCFSTQYELYGGSSSYDHGRFVYKKHIDNLPFITDQSTEEEIEDFDAAISEYKFDFIYPAMDGVLTVFSKFRKKITPVLIAPPFETARITRSKRSTYALLKSAIAVPRIFEEDEIFTNLPVFIKPDIGQGSVGTKKITSMDELNAVDFSKYLCLEYLPGEEYTVDCFTNGEGNLIFAKARGRKRIKNGISVNAEFIDDPIFTEYARRINEKLQQKGGWFFQVKKATDGTFKLLEVASRIAGASAITRCLGVNLPLLTVSVFDNKRIENVIPNNYEIELDRSLENVYRIGLSYGTAYIDYDDTLVERTVINTRMIQFLYQCINKGVKLVLLSKHDGNLKEELEQYRLSEVFDEIIHINRADDKYKYVTDKNAIFIDDSYGERKAIKEKCGIPVFDTHMIECLLED